MPFNSPGAPPSQVPGGAPIDDDDDELEANRPRRARLDILKWDQQGAYVEGVIVDYNPDVPDNDMSGKQREFNGKPLWQDAITIMVSNGTAVVQPAGSPEGSRQTVTPGGLVTEYVKSHNKFDRNRPEEYGMPFYTAKDQLGRGLRVGDRIRIDLMLVTRKKWDGTALQVDKKVRAYQVAAPETAEEFQAAEQARAMRKVLKAGAAPATGPTAPVSAPAAPPAPAPAAPTRGLFG